MVRPMASALAALNAALPSNRISFCESDRLAASCDLWPRHLIRIHQGKSSELPAAVVWPESAQQLQAIVHAARTTGLTLVPYGAGSSVVGSAMPTRDQVVVDLKRLSRILSIDATTGTATAQAGIMGELLERQLARQGMTQGHFPSSIFCSTLGGWLAARGAGQMSSRYGKIEDQVVGGEAVLGDGTLFRQPVSPVPTNVLRALIGSEGTLGFWTEATVRIHPQPEWRVFRAFDFSSLENSLRTARAWLLQGLVPSVLRIYDPLDSFLHRGTHDEHERRDRGPQISAALGAYFPRIVKFLGDRLAGPCRCIVGFEGQRSSVQIDMQTAVDMARATGAVDHGERPGLAWYNKRYAVSYRMSNVFRAGAAADTMEIACAWERVLPVYEAVRQAGMLCGAQILAHFSHMYLEGASIYFTLVLPASRGEAGYDRMWERCLGAAIAAGANVSHHHGIGQLKSAYLQSTLGGASATLTELRKRYDPDGVLNPTNLRSSTTPKVQMPADDSIGHDVGARFFAAPATHTLAEIEQTIQQESGATLGPAAQLFASLTVLDVARRGWLWRHNPQLHTIESAVGGVDGRVHGVEHTFIPAPRGAQGPDLITDLLQQDVSRLWLRSQTQAHRRLRQTTDPIRALEIAAALAAHPDARLLQVSVTIRQDGGTLDVGLPLGEARQGMAIALVHGIGDAAASYTLEDGAPTFQPLSYESLFFAGSWRAVTAFARVLNAAGLEFIVPWTDPVGAAGFVDGVQFDATSYAYLTTMGRRLEAIPQANRSAAPKLDTPTGAAPPSPSTPSQDLPRQLQLRHSKAPLDNCTYCPKLCRFTCPVAVAGASETLTPRQLMLTANLDKTSRRRLNTDSARHLWACVDCRGCRSACDHDNDVATVLQEARAELWDGISPPEAVRQFVDAFVREGRPPDTTATVPETPAASRSAPTALFWSCQNTVESAAARANAVTLATMHLGPVRQVGATLCCGQPLWRWGAREAFATHARKVARALGDGLQTLVVDDPGCAHTFKDLYPRIGVTLPPVRTIHSLLTDAKWDHLQGSWAPQDACYSSRWLDEPSLRQTVNRPDVMRAGSVLEGEAGCCGGMLLPFYDATLADEVSRAFAQDLLTGGGTRILAGAPTCSRRLRAVGVPVDDLMALWRPS